MSKIQHPSSLNPWRQYTQACSILSHTSRASNPAWYQQALELDLQLHIITDGPQVASYYLDRPSGQWTPGPQLTEEMLKDAEAFQPVLESILKKIKDEKAPSLGVILHVADEFATTELKPELDNPAALPDLRKLASDDPAEILEDTNVDPRESSFRILPYSAAGSQAIGTAVTISRHYDPMLDALRDAAEENNIPIITQSVSAPLVGIMALPHVLKSQPEKPFVAILQYSWFTALAFFNEHADLKLVRTLQHRGLRQASNFRNALFTTSASLEFLDPDLLILPLGSEIDEELEANLKQNFLNSNVETLQLPQAEGLPAWCAEPVIANLEPNDASPVSSMSFTTLHEDQWAYQDFLPRRREVAEMYPEKSEMGMLRITKLVRIFIIVLALGGVGYLGLGMWNISRMPEWSFDPGAANTAQVKVSMLNAEQRRINHWNNLLADRSKAWTVMESFARMFPQKGNMLIKDLSYSVKPDTGQGLATVGFVKVWKVSGFARDEALEYLNQLNTRDGINKHFHEMAKVTGSDSFRPDIGNRNISVNVRTRENSTFRPIPFDEAMINDHTTYPFTFDLTITQRFDATDPMALNVRTAP